MVVSSRQRQGRTLYDIAWEDESFGATSGAIPQTRVQPSSRPSAPCLAMGSPRDVASSTGVASRGPEPSPAPDPPLSPTHVPAAGSSPQQQDQPPPHAPGRKVEAKLGRHGAWCGATIVSFRGPNTNPTYTVKWDDASLGATSTRLPRSRVRQPQKSPSPPPRGDSSLTSPPSPSVTRNPLLTSSSARGVGQSPPSPLPSTRAHRTTGPPSVAPTRPPKQNRTPWAPLVGPSLGTPSPVTMAGQVPAGATVLLLYGDWAQAILDGVKTIEVRSKNTTKRSTIYLMSSGTDEVCGSVQILSSDLIPDEDAWRSLASRHRVGLAADPTQVAPFPSTPQYAWRLGTPIRFLRTVRSVRKQGQVDFLRFQPLPAGAPSSVPAGPALDGPPRPQPDTSRSGCPPPPSPPGLLPLLLTGCDLGPGRSVDQTLVLLRRCPFLLNTSNKSPQPPSWTLTALRPSLMPARLWQSSLLVSRLRCRSIRFSKMKLPRLSLGGPTGDSAHHGHGLPHSASQTLTLRALAKNGVRCSQPSIRGCQIISTVRSPTGSSFLGKDRNFTRSLMRTSPLKCDG